MLEVILTVGIPGSGKSTWAKSHVAKNPGNWVRINNDDLRSSFNGSVFSTDYEKLIASARSFILKEGLRKGKSVILDNLNLGERIFPDVCKQVQDLNLDVMVYEKPFYVELKEAIERDSQRSGSAQVGKDVITKWWNVSHGKQHKLYVPRKEIFRAGVQPFPAAFDPNLPVAIVCDLDGTLQKNHGRSFYDATTCDQDFPNTPVIEVIKMAHASGREIIFMSGREDCYREPTERFFTMHLPGIPYSLFMRATGDQRKDSIIKRELYDQNIRDKKSVLFWLDDRDQVIEMVRRDLGIICFQVDYGDF